MIQPNTELANNHAKLIDRMGHINDDYGAKARKTAQNYENYRNGYGGGVQFGQHDMEDESGFCSPPLWRTSPPRNPVQDDHQHLSKTSRAQAIARGQLELMEMVKNMPESSYELSLKDLVEQPRLMEARKERSMVEEGKFGNQFRYERGSVKRQESKKSEKKANMMRSGSIDNRGVFLKTGLPISFGLKKKKNEVKNTRAKVSPKPEAVSDKSSKGVEDWWRKRFSGNGESEINAMSSNNESSGGSSSSSRNSGNRKMSRCFPSFWPLFQLKKRISGK